MKKNILLLCILFSAAAVHAQTIISYGTNTIGKEEFLRAYNKNKTPVADKEKSLRDYLELYSNFKLKVKAAKDLRIDTLPQIQADVDNFRRQVVENYMNDEKELNALIDQAFERSQKNLHIIHFSIAVPEDASPEDSLKQFLSIKSLQKELLSGKTNYAGLAQSVAAKYNDLGYLTVFNLPYTLENLIYALKPGETSSPYRNKKAWHLFKLLDQRKDAGKWKVAQVLFTYPPGADEETIKLTKQLADSAYGLLLGGANFADVAQTFSNDKLTYMNGGELPEFGSGKFDQSFEKEVFSLQKDGDFTKPFNTSFGIHIVKRLGFTPTVTDKSDVALQFELKQKVQQDARISEAKEKFAKEIMTKIGFKRNVAVKDDELLRLADSVMIHPEEEYIEQLINAKKPVISFSKGSVKIADWLNFVKEYKGNFEQYKGESTKELWNKYLTIASLEYYKKHLEEYNEDFKFQMQEFKEGNMLFEVMEKNVWNKAGIDSAGLLKYFNANKDKYKWAESADVLVVNSVSEKAAAEAMAALKSGKPFRQLADENTSDLQIDSARYELSQLNGTSNSFAPGQDNYSGIVKNADGSTTFIKFIKFYEANLPRNFEDARGLVINDYQTVLEDKWLEDLRKKYPIKVNEVVVKALIK